MIVIDRSKTASDLGFPVAGFISEIYEGARILIHGSMWLSSNRTSDDFTTGTVMCIPFDGDMVRFVLLTDDENLQIPLEYARSVPIYFAID